MQIKTKRQIKRTSKDAEETAVKVAKIGDQTAMIVAPSGLTVSPKKKKNPPLNHIPTGKKIQCPLCEKEEVELRVHGPWHVGKLGFKCTEYDTHVYFPSNLGIERFLKRVDLSMDDWMKLRAQYADVNMPESARKRHANNAENSGNAIKVSKLRSEKEPERKETKFDKGLLDALREAIG